MRTDILEKRSQIEEWVAANVSKAEIAHRLHCKHTTLTHWLDVMGIKYNGNQGGKGVKTYKSKQYVPFEEYIRTCKVTTNRLRIKLLREGLKSAKCEVCGNDQWNGKAIPLEVHHRDGDNENNALENLEIICPNCHALTSNYRGKNIKKKSN